jgi:GT2 family glycosyltransferase
MPTSNGPDTAVVILCWNGKKFLEEFLPSLIQNNPERAEIIVADNASTDDSVAFVKKHFPTVRLLLLEKNYGFAEGYNQAIKRIDAPFIVLINQDVRVSNNWLPPLIEMMEQDLSIGALQPRIHAHLQPAYFEYAGAAGGWIDRYGYTFCRGRVFDSIEEDRNQYALPEEIFWASGACLLVRKKIFESTGGLDGDFFAHMEEIDFCWRLKNAGYKVMYCPHSVVYHLGGGSLPHGNPFKTHLNFRNNLAMIAKNLNEKRFTTLLLRMALDQLAALRFLAALHFKDFWAVQQAHFHFLLQLRKINDKRTKAIAPFLSMKGVYEGSIVWDYFLKGRKNFNDIIKK